MSFVYILQRDLHSEHMVAEVARENKMANVIKIFPKLYLIGDSNTQVCVNKLIIDTLKFILLSFKFRLIKIAKETNIVIINYNYIYIYFLLKFRKLLEVQDLLQVSKRII